MNEIIKIKDENPKGIEQALFKAMILVGFNPKKIDPISLDVIVKNISRNFKHLSLEEFDLAFELGVNGKLGIDLNTYQNFNALYVSNVLLAYKRYKAKQNTIKTLEISDSKQLEAPKMSKEANALKWYKWTVAEIEKSGKIPFISDWDAVFWHMKNEGLIELDKDEMEMFAEIVRGNMEHDFKKRKAENRNSAIIREILDKPKSFKCECRKQYLIKYFENKLL